jgi:hypothetical protein
VVKREPKKKSETIWKEKKPMALKMAEALEKEENKVKVIKYR